MCPSRSSPVRLQPHLGTKPAPFPYNARRPPPATCYPPLTIVHPPPAVEMAVSTTEDEASVEMAAMSEWQMFARLQAGGVGVRDPGTLEQQVRGRKVEILSLGFILTPTSALLVSLALTPALYTTRVLSTGTAGTARTYAIGTAALLKRRPLQNGFHRCWQHRNVHGAHGTNGTGAFGWPWPNSGHGPHNGPGRPRVPHVTNVARRCCSRVSPPPAAWP